MIMKIFYYSDKFLNILLVNNILFDCIEWFLRSVLSSVIIDEERIVFDNDGDIDSDNDWNIKLDRWLLTDKSTLFELYNDDNEIISELISNFLSSFVERIHYNKEIYF